MRKLGFLLLAIGFLWLAGSQLGNSMRIGARPVLDAQYKKIEAHPGQTHSRAEVEERVLATATAAYDAAPSSFVLPGLLMLLGGILASRHNRRTQKRDA